MQVFEPFKYYLDIDLSYTPSEEEMQQFREKYMKKSEVKESPTEFTLQIENKNIGKVIGKSGVNIADIRDKTKCYIKIDNNDVGGKRKVTINGDNAEMAKNMIMNSF